MNAFRANFISNPSSIGAGEPAALVFSIHDAESNIVKRIQITHEKPVHLIVVSADLNEFYHLHPEQDERGTFTSNHIFPWGGAYRLYLDFTPVNEGQTVASFLVNVQGPKRKSVDSEQDFSLTKEVDGIRVTASYEKPLLSGKDVTMLFDVTNAVFNSPITDLELYVGARAHIIIIAYTSGEMLHVHPLDHNVTHQTHSLPNVHHMPSASNIIRASTRFPSQGRYKLWVQFKWHGTVKTVPFEIDIAH